MQATYLAMERMSKENGGQVLLFILTIIVGPLLFLHQLIPDYHHCFCPFLLFLYHHLSDQGGLIINTASAAGIIFGDQDPALVDIFFILFTQSYTI